MKVQQSNYIIIWQAVRHFAWWSPQLMVNLFDLGFPYKLKHNFNGHVSGFQYAAILLEPLIVNQPLYHIDFVRVDV